MALAVGASCVVSLVLSILTFSGMQMAKPLLVSSQPATIAAGFLGSVLFVFLLTFTGNLERMLFGAKFQTKWPESLVCLAVAAAAAGSVHRVAATTSVIFSLMMLYSIVNIAIQTYDAKPSSANDNHSGGKAEKSKKKK